ncbi:MAG TPA: hypothetical protein VEV84_09450, partial [Pyrinomonadaceae bacterium]|nr:hypothetical protein [Pyrinomonadaceae bacterium]
MADEPALTTANDHDQDAMLVMADDTRFSKDEMVACSECNRKNPPNRLACLYCGAGLDIAEIRSDIAKITFQRPEPWEDGFTIAYVGSQDLSIETIESAAKILQLELETFAQLLSPRMPVPIIYLKSLAEAQVLASQLSEIGFGCAVVGDDLLTPRRPPTRLRSLEFSDKGAVFLDFNTNLRFEFSYGDKLLLI